MTKKSKCFLSILLATIFVFTSNIFCFTVLADNESVGVYTGTVNKLGYTAHVTITIDKIVNDRFRGSVSVTNVSPYNKTNIAVEGTVNNGINGYTFSCPVDYYNTNCWLTVDRYDGTARCFAIGDYYISADFDMSGNALSQISNWDISGNANFNKSDMLMCSILCSKIFSGKEGIYNYLYIDEQEKPNDTSELMRNKYNYDLQKIISYNNDSIASTNYYTVINRQNSLTEDIDIIVIVRSTEGNEWIGNADITGTNYNPNYETHYSYNVAKESIKYGIEKYYDQLKCRYPNSNINLIITGHSRGGAVANLYAKEALDKLNGLSVDTMPSFDSVVAYTFGSPNVAKYNSSMENYSSIFNFCLEDDIVTRLPFSNPLGWNYWKYGKTYVATTNNRIISYLNEIDENRAYWTSIDNYYNKDLLCGTGITHLYNVTRTGLGFKYRTGGTVYYLRNNFLSNRELRKLGVSLAKYWWEAPHTHDLVNYINAVKTLNFYETSHDSLSVISKTPIKKNLDINNSEYNNRINTEYNNYEKNRLITLYNYLNNSNYLEWDITDPSTWTGITWNSSGNVTAIDLPYLDLEGTLDLSDFSALESVNLSGNKLTSIDLTDCDSLINLNVSSNNLTSLDVSDCTELETLDCSFNDLSTDGLDVSANTALTSLTCDDCGLITINISTLTELEELSCAFNELTTINIDSNTALTTLICCYNYMDTHEGGTLYNKFDDLLFSDVYVNYYPQAVPDNATFNTSELNALKTFALTENNNAALDWLDENDNVDTDKLQNNVLFEYDGSAYRVVAVDVADTEVEGALNISALAKLQELYCENTDITSVNVNNCTVLNTLSCDNCKITSLTLPSNAAAKNTPLYDVSCEYNYIDTRIFTDTMVDYITFKAGATLEYENQKGDNSALVAVMEFSDTLNSNDYSESSFSNFSEIIEDYVNYEYLLLTQTDIDELVTEVLTAINELEPYLNLKISGNNGTITIVYDNEPQSGSTHSLLFGTPVTLTATADEGYVFDGWYEKVIQRKFSSNSTYTFKITTNMDLEARFVRTGDVTLTFTNDTGQVVAKIDKSVSEWSDVTGIADLLPEVPYKLGHTNGRWNYTEADVLAALQAGNDVTITPVYDDSTYEYPTVPTPADNVPLLNLYYSLDSDNNIGSFTMAAGIPQDLNIEAIGIGFYYKKAASFNPSNFILNINNKMLTSRFDNTDSDGIYIVNINKFISAYNWCARGYITYYDENNELKTVYSNQINIADRIAVT